jgi:predicted dehydrogenase
MEVEVSDLRWGILGTGRQAARFLRQLIPLPDHVVVSCGSRSRTAADELGAEFSIPKCCEGYQAVLDDPDVDIVYISLPNHLHKEWSIRCAQAGKHILCEKPLAVNRREVAEVLDHVVAGDVFLMEAFMYRCHPQIARLVELIRSGRIGEVRMMQGSFSYNMGPQYANIRMSNAMAGGGLMDVGAYAVSLARLVAGCEPVESKAVARIGPLSRVDEQASISLGFSSGAVASLSCGMQVQVEHGFTVLGSEGSIHLPAPWFGPSQPPALVVTDKTGASEEIDVSAEGVGVYALEARHVAEHLSDRQAPAMTWADSIGNVIALDALRESIGLRFDCE